MTVIAVKKNGNKIELSSDNQTTMGKYMKITSERENHSTQDAKIYQINDMIVGASGNVDISFRLKRFMETHKPKGNTIKDIEDYFVEFYDYSKKIDNKFEPKNQYIMIYQKKIFAIHRYYFDEVNNYYAIGSGMNYALSTMYLGFDTKRAVSVAKEFDPFCSGETKTVVIDI